MSSDVDAPAGAEIEPLLEEVGRWATPLLSRYNIPETDREDLVQEVLTAYWARRQQIEDPRLWLIGALRRQCFDYLRRSTRRRSRPFQEDLRLLQAIIGSSTAAKEERLFLKSDLNQALSQIPDRQRAVLLLRFREGLTPAEAADRLGYKASSMKKITNRALHALREELRANGYRPPP